MASDHSRAPHLRRLSESEIQDRLYGEYRTGRRRRPAESETVPIAPVESYTRGVSPPAEPAWTGQEILSSELRRISQALTTLQQEREQVASELTRRVPAPVHAMPVPETPEPVVIWSSEAPRPGSSLWAWAGGMIVAAAILAVALHTVVLEAQAPLLGPSPGTLYSVQVGVYNSQAPAQRFVDRLSQEGHPAFLVPAVSHRGALRYRVYVGRYPSKLEAQVQLDRLRRHPLLADSFILQRN